MTNGLSSSISSGGVEIVVRHIYRAFEDTEFNIKVFATCDSGDEPIEKIDPSYEVIPTRRMLASRSWSRVSFKSLKVLLKLVQQSDLVHIHLCKDFMTVASALFCRISKKPMVVQSHGMIVNGSSLKIYFSNLFLKYLVANAPFLCLTEKEKTTLSKIGFTGEKHLITNPMSIEEISVFRGHDKHYDMVFISRFHLRKRPSVVIEAASLLTKHGFKPRVLMAGTDDGCYSETVQNAIDLGLDKSIKFPGSLNQKEVKIVLRQAKCFVLPSYGEIFPMAALEAAAASTPIILGSDCPLAQELASRGAALLADTPEELANAVQSIIESDKLANDLIQNAHSWVSDKCSYPVYRESMASIYGNLVNPNRFC